MYALHVLERISMKERGIAERNSILEILVNKDSLRLRGLFEIFSKWQVASTLSAFT